MIWATILIFILFFYLTFRSPLWALFLFSALLPSYLIRFKIFGLPTTVLEVAIWAMFISWLIFYHNFSFLKKRLDIIRWPLLMFFAISVLAIVVSPAKINALGIWRAYFLEAILFFLLLLAVIKDKKDFEKIIFGLSIPAIYLSLYAILQRFFGVPIPEPWQSNLRATSLFPYPNALGLFLGPLIILFIYQIINNKKLLTISYWTTATVLSFIAIIFAQSDGAIIAVIAALGIFILLNLFFNKKYKSGIVLIFLILLAGGLLFGTIAPVQEKIILKDWSGFVRLTMWGETWNMLKDNWFFGAGLSGFQEKIIPFHESRDWMEIFLYPHNIILNFWSELGLLGLAAFLWLLERFGKLCYTVLKREKLFAISAICAMAVIIIHGLVDVPYFKNDLSIIFWIIYAMPLIDYKL